MNKKDNQTNMNNPFNKNFNNIENNIFLLLKSILVKIYNTYSHILNISDINFSCFAFEINITLFLLFIINIFECI